MAKINLRNRNLGKLDKDGKPKAANWEYRFEAAKIDGKRKSISHAGYRTKKDAEIAGAKALAEYNLCGTKYDPSDMSVADFLDMWYELYVKTTLKYRTQLSYKVIIDNHLKPALGRYKLKALTPLIIQDYVNHKFASGLKKHTLTSIVCCLTGALKYAVIPSGLIPSSPAAYIKYPKVEKAREEVNRTVLSVSDIDLMLERFRPGNPFRYAILIGFYAGLRIGETYGLTWQDIDFNEKTLSVKRQLYSRNIGSSKSIWCFGSTKTKTSVRTIKIGDTLLKELKEFRSIQLQNQMAYGEHYTMIYQQDVPDERGNTIVRLIESDRTIPIALPTADLIMRKDDGSLCTSDSFKYAARVIHYDLGITFNYHSLRHTHATMLIESGVSPKSVQMRLGHSDIRTTLQTYVHNTDAMEQTAVDVFEKAVKAKQA